MARRGLAVLYYFPPAGGGGVQRWTKFIKYLSRNNWRFTVITAPPESSAPQDPGLLSDLPENIKIIRPDLFRTKQHFLARFKQKISKGYWQRWLGALFYVTDSRHAWNQYFRVLIDQELNSAQYDALFFSIPPYSLAELAGHYTANHTIPVFLDMRDPWTINPYKIHPTPIHRFWDRKRELLVIASIRNIIVAYQSILQDYQQHVPDFSLKNTILMPNGYDDEDFLSLASNPAKVDSKFTLGFSGTFYSHLNRPDNLFAALASLTKTGEKVHFHHVGESSIDLPRLAAKHGIADQIHVHGYQNHDKALNILNGLKALCVILDERIQGAENTVGGKVYEYLRLKKPILAMVPENGETADLIRKTQAGVVCSSFDPDAISKVIKKMIYGKITFNYTGIDGYSRKNQAEILNKFISRIINETEDKRAST